MSALSPFSPEVRQFIASKPPCFVMDASAQDSLQRGEFLIRPNSQDARKLTIVYYPLNDLESDLMLKKKVLDVDANGNIKDDESKRSEPFKTYIVKLLKRKMSIQSQPRLEDEIKIAYASEDIIRWCYLKRIESIIYNKNALFSDDVLKVILSKARKAIDDDKLADLRYFIEVLNIDVNSRIPTSETLAMYALQKEREDILSYLASSAAKLDGDSKHLETLLDRIKPSLFRNTICKNFIVSSVCAKGYIDPLLIMVEKGIDITQKIPTKDHLGMYDYTAIDLIMSSEIICANKKVTIVRRLGRKLFQIYQQRPAQEQLNVMLWLNKSMERYAQEPIYRNIKNHFPLMQDTPAGKIDFAYFKRTAPFPDSCGNSNETTRKTKFQRLSKSQE